MTRIAVLRDLPAVAAGVRVVVAPETSGEIGVPDIERILAPRNLHLGEYISRPDLLNLVARFGDLAPPLPIYRRIALPVELRKLRGYPRGRVLTARILRLQHLHGLLLREGKAGERRRSGQRV